MYLYRAKYLLSFFFIVAGVKVVAQTSTISNPTSEHENIPYSMFGIGTLWNGNNAVLKGMGNVSSAYENHFEVNTDNPASYSFLSLTTYEGALEGSMSTLATNTTSYATGTASLAYMNIGIPLGKHAGMCIGLKPYSHVYYQMHDTTADPVLGQTIKSFSGEGSMNYLFIGGAAKWKNLSLGFNFGYLFGTIRATSGVLDLNDTTYPTSYDAEFSKYTHIGGIYWKGGALYAQPLSKGYTLYIGGTITLSQTLKATDNEYWIGSHNFGDTTVQDTSRVFSDPNAKMTLPMSYSLGVMLASGDKWTVGLDYSSTQWSQFKNPYDFSTDTTIAKQSYKMALGGEFTPNTSAFTRGHYFSRATYRFGLYYGKDYVRVQNTDLNNYGVTFGASFPIRRSTSQVHTAFDIGQVGTKTNGLIQQTYVRFTLGLSFNDKWFQKRKYE